LEEKRFTGKAGLPKLILSHNGKANTKPYASFASQKGNPLLCVTIFLLRSIPKGK
jgi:hypothetical protein